MELLESGLIKLKFKKITIAAVLRLECRVKGKAQRQDRDNSKITNEK